MKITTALSIFSLLLPISASAAAKPLPLLQRILITLQVLEIPANSAYNPAPGKYPGLLKDGGEAAEIVLQTANDVPSSTIYNKTTSFKLYGNKAETLNFMTLTNKLAARPHINADGTITVKLEMGVGSVVPPKLPAVQGSVPQTRGTYLETTRTFKNGETILITAFEDVGQTLAGPKTELLQFVTVTVLPDEKAAAQ